jgi:CHAD domain-containing protein
MEKELVRLLKAAEDQYLKGEASGWDVDAVHDYRVAIRRTRAYLKIWQCDDIKRQKQMQEELRVLQRLTGFVREWDVFAIEFREALSDQAIDRAEFARFIQIQSWKEEREIWQRMVAESEDLNGKLKKDSRDLLLDRILEEIKGEKTSWHRLRIRIKRYRYELERQGKAEPDWIRVLKGWQDLLGLIQDAETNEKWFVWLHEEEGLANLGNRAVKKKLLEEANQALAGFMAQLKGRLPEK